MCVIVFDVCKYNSCQHSVRCDNTTSGFRSICTENYKNYALVGIIIISINSATCCFHGNTRKCMYECAVTCARQHLYFSTESDSSVVTIVTLA